MTRTPRLGIVATAALLLPATVAQGNRGGAFAGLNGSVASAGGSCTMCHGEKVGSGSVVVLGAPVAYQVSALYDLTIRVADDEQAGAGFQISVEDGSGTHVGQLIVSDPLNTRESPGPSGWLTHTSDGVDESVASWSSLGNAAEYNVQWRAPSDDVGPLTFYVAGNAINDDGSNDGDRIYLASQTATALPICPSDIDRNGFVDVQDLVQVILAWGTGDAAADVNQDGVVDVLDLTQIILDWGPC